jgi:hypothetical protein
VRDIDSGEVARLAHWHRPSVGRALVRATVADEPRCWKAEAMLTDLGARSAGQSQVDCTGACAQEQPVEHSVPLPGRPIRPESTDASNVGSGSRAAYRGGLWAGPMYSLERSNAVRMFGWAGCALRHCFPSPISPDALLAAASDCLPVNLALDPKLQPGFARCRLYRH